MVILGNPGLQRGGGREEEGETESWVSEDVLCSTLRRKLKGVLNFFILKTVPKNAIGKKKKKKKSPGEEWREILLPHVCFNSSSEYKCRLTILERFIKSNVCVYYYYYYYYYYYVLYISSGLLNYN